MSSIPKKLILSIKWENPPPIKCQCHLLTKILYVTKCRIYQISKNTLSKSNTVAEKTILKAKLLILNVTLTLILTLFSFWSTKVLN